MKPVLKFVPFLLCFFLIYSCKLGSSTSSSSEEKSKDEFITVLLKKNITPEMFLEKYNSWGLIQKNFRSKSQNLWHFDFDQNTIAGSELLKQLESSNMVEKADLIKGGAEKSSGTSNKKGTVTIKNK